MSKKHKSIKLTEKYTLLGFSGVLGIRNHIKDKPKIKARNKQTKNK